MLGVNARYWLGGWAAEKLGAARTLGDIMLSDIPTVHEAALLANVVANFLKMGTRRLVVTDDAGRPIGLINDADAVMRVQPSARR